MQNLSMVCINLLIHFFYPSFCLHCEGTLKKNHHLLCPSCFELIEWIHLKDRCLYCRGPTPCLPCRKFPRPLLPHLSLFEGVGPLLSLYHHFLKTKEGQHLAPFLLLALNCHGFPLPDLIVPNTTKVFAKKEPSYLLALALSRLIKRPLRLPGGSLQNQTLLLITPHLQNTKNLLDMKRTLKGFFPRKIYSIALIDSRTSEKG